MAQTLQAFSRDANGVPITTYGMVASKTITYAAATTGAVASSTLFTVTGDILANVFAICSTTLTSGGAATIEVGVASLTAGIIAQTTATNITAKLTWPSASPALVKTNVLPFIIGRSQNILQEIKTTTITGGTLTYYCIWTPLSSDGNVVAA